MNRAIREILVAVAEALSAGLDQDEATLRFLARSALNLIHEVLAVDDALGDRQMQTVRLSKQWSTNFAFQTGPMPIAYLIEDTIPDTHDARATLVLGWLVEPFTYDGECVIGTVIRVGEGEEIHDTCDHGQVFVVGEPGRRVVKIEPWTEPVILEVEP